MSYYIHEVPGRLRVKIPSVKRNPREAKAIQTLLRRVIGVGSVSVNPITGSVVAHFDASVVTSKFILSVLSREGYMDLSRAMSHQQYVEAAFAKVGREASMALLGYAIDRVLQGTPLAVVAALI
jgi:copper chaperone CopZ